MNLVSSTCGIVSDVPTVSETKLNFLKAYKRPIPSVYSAVLQELLVQQHLMRYKRTYQYDAVFALGFVTVFDRLMEGYPSDEDREAIFQAYVKALEEDPEKYRQVNKTKFIALCSCTSSYSFGLLFRFLLFLSRL